MVRKGKQRLILLCANRRAECGANTCRFFSLRQFVYATHNIPKDFLVFLALNIGVKYPLTVTERRSVDFGLRRYLFWCNMCPYKSARTIPKRCSFNVFIGFAYGIAS